MVNLIRYSIVSSLRGDVQHQRECPTSVMFSSVSSVTQRMLSISLNATSAKKEWIGTHSLIKEIHVYHEMAAWMYIWMDGWMMNGWMDGWVVGWMDGGVVYRQTEKKSYNEEK